MASLQNIQFVKHRCNLLRRYYVDENDVRTVLERLPEHLFARLRKIHFNDRARGNRILGYTTKRGRRDISLCALPHRLSLSRARGGTPAEFGAIKGSQWPVLAIRRYQLYNTLLHEIGHLQVVRSDQNDPNRKYADEAEAQEFADYWRHQLWNEDFDHIDPVHGSPGQDELLALESGWIDSHLSYKHGLKREQEGDRKAAMVSYKKAIDSYSDHTLAIERFGVLSYANPDTVDQIDNEEMCALYLHRALRLDPTLFDATLYLGMALHRLEEYKEARIFLRRAIYLGPYSEIAKCVYAEHLGYWGEYQEAESIFKTLLKKEPDFDLASKYYKNMRDSRDAEAAVVCD